MTAVFLGLMLQSIFSDDVWEKVKNLFSLEDFLIYLFKITNDGSVSTV